MTRVAVLDDWQNVARSSADWAPLQARAEVRFFDRPLGGADEVAAALADFDVVVAMRERTAFAAELLGRLPKLRMIALTGGRAPTLDLAACTARGIVVSNTGGNSGGATAELAIGLLLAAARQIPAGDAAMRDGRFQEGVGVGIALEGRTLGVIGLGRIGGRVARVAQAMGMRVTAWSENLTEERAREAGVAYAPRDELLQQADAVTLHLVLSPRTRGILGAAELGRMKRGAILVNTSRGPLVDGEALLAALQEGRIFAALDVYDEEPLTADHPLRSAPNTVLTPHVGYGTREIFATFYRESVANVLAFLDGAPVRMLNPEARRV